MTRAALTSLASGRFVARMLDPDDQDEMERARAFRYRVFLDELEWSLDDEGKLESDEYDEGSVHLGAFSDSDAGELLGYCRLILPGEGFMIEREFADLVDPSHRVRRQKDTTEISRFAIRRDLRGKPEGFMLIGLLLQAVYRWARTQGVRYIYGVCATDHLHFVLDHFACVRSIGPSYEYQPGVCSSALLFDLQKLDVGMAQEFWSLVVAKPRP